MLSLGKHIFGVCRAGAGPTALVVVPVALTAVLELAFPQVVQSCGYFFPFLLPLFVVALGGNELLVLAAFGLSLLIGLSISLDQLSRDWNAGDMFAVLLFLLSGALMSLLRREWDLHVQFGPMSPRWPARLSNSPGTNESFSSNASQNLTGHETGTTAALVHGNDRQRAELALQASEERLRLAIEQTGMATWEVDLLHRRVTWSSTHFTLFGYEPRPDGRASYRLWADRLHPDDRDRVLASFELARQHRIKHVESYRILRADTGEVRWVHGVGQFLADADGKLTRCVGIVFDETDRKRAEQRLVESEARFRQMAARMPQIVYVTLADDTIEYDNGRWYELTGVGLVRMQEVLEESDFALLQTTWANAKLSHAEYSCEVRIRHKASGAQRWYLWRGVPLIGDDGQAEKWYATLTDIHEQKVVTEQLRASEEQLRIALDAARMASWDWDLGSGEIQWTSRTYDLLGVPLETTITRELLRSRMRDDDAIEDEIACERAFESGLFHSEYRRKMPDGTTRWFRDQGRVLRGATGQPERVIGVVSEFTEARHAEQQLRDSEARLGLTLQSAGMGMWLNSMPLDRLGWDARTRELFFVGPDEEVTIELFWGRLHPEDVEPTRLAAQLAVSERMLYAVDHRAVHPTTGEVRWIRSSGRVSFAADGTPVRFDGVSYDVTPRKRVELALRDARARIESLLNAAEIGTWDYDVEQNRVWADPNLARLFGVTPEDANGGPIDAYLRAIHPADIERVRLEIATALAHTDSFESVYRVRPTETEVRWIIARATIRRGSHGNAVRLPGVVVDITGQREIEDRLRLSEARFRTLFNTMDEGFCVIQMVFDDAGAPIDYLFLETNPAFEKLTGLSNAVGRRMTELAAGMEGYWFERYGNVALTGHTERFSAQAAQLEGRWFDVSAFPLGEEGDRRVAVLFTDITERRQASIEREALVGQLQEQDRRKDQFLATLAHELRNPLAPLRNGLEVLRLSRIELPELEVARQMMERQVAQMVRLIDDLLDLSRISRGKVELRIAPVCLKDVIEQAIETSRPLIEKERHRLLVELPEQRLIVAGDATRLAQVFANLLNNAAKYTEAGGQISLTLEATADTASVRIRDTGIGIPADMLPRVFEMFTQVDRSLEKARGGLGIGLSLVRGLVENHGGAVEAHSAGPGQGSEFVVRLPLLPVVDEPLSTDDARPLDEPQTERHRILVVDDNRDAAQTLAQMLTLLGHQTRLAHDGLEALKLAEEWPPDVVLLDIGMPKLNGYDTAARMRQLDGGADMLLVALTGWGQDDDRRRSQEAGFDLHMVKPIEPRALLEILRER